MGDFKEQLQVIMISIGSLLVAYAYFIYDSAPEGTHNIGLIQNQSMTLNLGFFLVIVGLLLKKNSYVENSEIQNKIERNDMRGDLIDTRKNFKTVDDELKFSNEEEKNKKAEVKNINAPATEYLNTEASELGITFDGELYHYKAYRYQSLKDALAYARLGKD